MCAYNLQVENKGNRMLSDELYDGIYSKYMELIHEKSNEGPYYKHYILNKNAGDELVESIITIQESTSIVSQGTTGLCTWQVILNKNYTTKTLS